jgi:FkbM family methyltransferase
MSILSSPIAIRLRSIARSLGITRTLGRLFAPKNYEDRFGVALLSGINAGDHIWDVGANIGLYSLQLADKAGMEGRVFSFEPSPSNVLRLKKAVARHSNIHVIDLALADRNGAMKFRQGEDELGATSRLVEGGAETGAIVEVVTGDSLVAQGRVKAPNVIKIDTEGFELDVLRGMTATLAQSTLRLIGVEVHFGLLAERGMADAPQEIEKMLKLHGFRCEWVDASHLIAKRHK